MFRARPLIARATYATTVAALLLAPGAARGNGDPPSNVLLNQQVYLPPGTPPTAAGRIRDTVASANSGGYPVRVALVLTARDLGNIPQFFDRPQDYADHLTQETGVAGWRGDVLVVMPAGAGVAARARVAEKRAAIASARPAAPTAEALARTADRAVRDLAAAAGRPVGAGGGSIVPALAVLGGLLLAGGGAAVWRLRSPPPPAPDDPQRPAGEAGGERELPGV